VGVHRGSPGLLVALLATFAASAGAQSIRVSGVTSLQGIDLRPLVDDSASVTLATGTGPYRLLPDGRLVRCVDGEPFCRFRRSGDRTMATPLVQDLMATGWGLGEGISGHAHIRARSALGSGDLVWPRSSDEFDALEAWMQLERERFRVRLGRQWAATDSASTTTTARRSWCAADRPAPRRSAA
jgi:hypothetical protein